MRERPSRRRVLQAAGASAAVALTGLWTARQARAHSFPEAGFTVIHPWCDETPRGARDWPVQLRIIDISVADRLIAASTPVSDRMTLLTPAYITQARGAAGPPGVALHPGRDLVMNRLTPHFVLDHVNTDLRFGFEYPLALVFEQAGEISAALIIGLD